MNYLSHFYFDQAQTDSAYITGIALPDLCKLMDKKIHINPDSLNTKDLTSEIDALNKGWAKHLEVDALFHNAELFKKWMSVCNTNLRKIEFPRYVKAFILGHIAVELMLDFYLLEQKKVSTEVFYHHLEKIQPQTIHQFFSLHNIVLPFERVEEPYQRFLSTKYLASYTTFRNLSYAISRIMYRIWAELPDETLQTQIANELERSYLQISHEFDEIFEYIHQSHAA